MSLPPVPSDAPDRPPAGRPTVVLLRGYSANPWDLRPWRRLADRYDVRCLVARRNEHDAERLGVATVEVHGLRDYLPRGRPANAVTLAVGDRYVGLERHLRGTQIVHSADLATWFTGQAATLRPTLGYRLVLTVWETLPLLDALRWRWERRARAAALDAVDLYLPATERARDALLLEGVDPGRIEVCPPGIDTAHFARGDRATARPDEPPLVLSPGRLVWEKGHQDVLRAVAAIRRGVVPAPERLRHTGVLVVGDGPERDRLRDHARDLGLGDAVSFRAHVPYDAMPDVYARAAAVCLASLVRPGWEEQFGMVLAEAMAASVPVVTTTSGAIPEVTGEGASRVAAGDWMGLARALVEVLTADPAARPAPDPARVRRFSDAAAAERLAAAYDRVLARA